LLLDLAMNPLSPLTYYRRHKLWTVSLLGLIGLVTAGLYLMIALSYAIFIEPMRLNSMFLTKFSVVFPLHQNDLDPATVAQISLNPDVAEVIPTTMYYGLSLPEVMGGQTTWLSILALREEHLAYVMERCRATLIEGQLLEARTNGVMLSKEVAANLGLQVGDIIHNSVDPRIYHNILAPMQVVGILESDVRLVIVSYEYLDDHELYSDLRPMILVIANQDRQDAVQDFLVHEIQTARTEVWTYQELADNMAREYRQTNLLIIPIAMVVALATSLVVGAVNRIAFSRRLPELGALHATGYSRVWLTSRLTKETGMLAFVGCVLGVALSWLALYGLKLFVFTPRGHDLDIFALAPVLVVSLIPMIVLGSTRISTGRILSKLDPVAIVEWGEQSLEGEQWRGSASPQGAPKPLSSITFYRRHTRRFAFLTGAMTLMIVAVATIIFVFAASNDARLDELNNLSRMSVVRSRPGVGLDPGVVSQVRNHPSVERVIPYFSTWDLRFNVSIPPFGELDVYPYAVHAKDMVYLVELYGLELKEGHLPSPHTNQLVVSENIAQNLDLQVGEVIGDPDRPAYPGAPDLPVAFVVSGIFAEPGAPEERNWLSFASLEYLESHEAFDISGKAVFPLVAVPKAGQKAALDAWLEDELANEDVWPITYQQQVDQANRQNRSLIQAMTMIESVLAIVAAIGLAVLNHIYSSQRRSEFGVLHALGYGRMQIVRRALGEIAFTTSAAWALSAMVCLAALLFLQFGVYRPLGFSLDPFNPTPWLLTLPIPLAVLAVTAGTVACTLSRLDPVSIIERR